MKDFRKSIAHGPPRALVAGLLLALAIAWPAVAEDAFLQSARAAVAAAAEQNSPWTGPVSGPAAVPRKTIVYVADDLRNGGILGAAEGAREAAAAIGWNIRVVDAQGTQAGREDAFRRALALRPDGLIVGGMDARENLGQLRSFQLRGIPVVGWHAGPDPGPVEGTPVIANVTTDATEVARVAALYAVVRSNGTAGVVVFTDSNFQIAMHKAEIMAETIRRCGGCAVLEMEDVAISRAADEMGAVTRRLLQAHGARWTHSLAINDIYFDFAASVLVLEGIPPSGRISNISAGDGSPSAFRRIRQDSYQAATVPEPLLLQGWQLIDELNRAFAGVPPSGYIAPVHLVTPENLDAGAATRDIFDPDNGYREIYRGIWKR